MTKQVFAPQKCNISHAIFLIYLGFSVAHISKKSGTETWQTGLNETCISNMNLRRDVHKVVRDRGELPQENQI